MRRSRPAHRKPEDAGKRAILTSLQLLQGIAEAQWPETLTDISELVDMSSSQAYRYLTGLGQVIFLHQDLATGCYGIGPPRSNSASLQWVGKLDAVRLCSISCAR